MAQCLIALGGNLGISEALLQKAFLRLQRPGIETRQLSRVCRTKPVGSQAGDEFLNAAATLETSLAPAEVLSILHQVEQEFGRTRTIHWGPRTLDLDLILYEDLQIDSPDLVVPHPAMWYRRFVLDPAVEIAGSWRHPILHQSLLQLHSRLSERPVRITVDNRQKTLTDEACNGVLQSLNGRSSDIVWIPVTNSSGENVANFARMLVRSPSKSANTRRQPANFGDRTVVVECDTSETMEMHLEQFASAVLG